MKMANKFVSCRACGNRYPKDDGYGYLNEFCSAGCFENWCNSHPVYYKKSKRKGRIKTLWALIKLAFLIFAVVWIIKTMFNP